MSDGVLRYEVPHQLNPCHQRGGCVVVHDAVTGEQKWVVQVYCTAYDPFLEQDVQDVFITSLALANGVLSVVDEKGRQFQISTTTRVVTGATGGCIRQGCISARVSWWLDLPVLLWFVRRQLRGGQRTARRSAGGASRTPKPRVMTVTPNARRGESGQPASDQGSVSTQPQA